jgi:hypothetical protein
MAAHRTCRAMGEGKKTRRRARPKSQRGSRAIPLGEPAEATSLADGCKQLISGRAGGGK